MGEERGRTWEGLVGARDERHSGRVRCLAALLCLGWMLLFRRIELKVDELQRLSLRCLGRGGTDGSPLGGQEGTGKGKERLDRIC